MALTTLPGELVVSISEQLEECDINALSQTNVHLCDLLNEVLYQQNVNNLQGTGAWRAVKNGNADALMKFITYELNIHACGQPSNFTVNKVLVGDDTVVDYEEHDEEKREETKEEAAEKDKEKEKKKNLECIIDWALSRYLSHLPNTQIVGQSRSAERSHLDYKIKTMKTERVKTKKRDE